MAERTLGCDCPGTHVQLRIGGTELLQGVHLVGPAIPPAHCPREASQEDGVCDICREFLIDEGRGFLARMGSEESDG